MVKYYTMDNNFESLYYRRKGSGLNLGIDFQSIERVGRTVIGFATIDNVDFAGDVVPIEASIKAFQRFRGNIRVQHDKNRPVGKLLGFEVAEVHNPETGETHKGILVAVQVSEGAEDVWKMVEDGTLSGFSIGAAVLRASKIFNEESKRSIQVIDEYVLTELSLVDSPMNELTNVISVHKSFDYQGEEVEKDFTQSSLLWCAVDRKARKSKDTAIPCSDCGEPMVSLGYIQDNADINTQLNKVFELSQKGGHPQVADTVNKDAEGGEVVPSESEATVDQVEETVEEVVAEDTANELENSEVSDESADEVVAEEVEEAVAEVDTENEDTSDTVEAEATVALDDDKLDEFLKNLIETIRTEVLQNKGLDEETSSRLERVEKGIEDIKDIFNSFKTTQEEVTAKMADFEGKLSQANQRLGVLSDATAVKKSLDSEYESPAIDAPEHHDPMDGLFSTNIDGWDA